MPILTETLNEPESSSPKHAYMTALTTAAAIGKTIDNIPNVLSLAAPLAVNGVPSASSYLR